MPQINIFVKITKHKGNSVRVQAVNDSVSIDRFITKSKVETKEKLATWLLSQIKNTTEQESSKQGVLSINYHSEQIQEGDELVETLVIDDVSKNPLPLVLRKNLQNSLSAIDSIVADDTVKQAFKEVLKGIYFLSN